MNFFEHQAQAQKKTMWLVFMLALAVICLIGMTIFCVSVFFYYFQIHATSMHAVNAYSTDAITHFWYIVQSPIALWVTFAVSAVVLGGSTYKFMTLRRGGVAVAESLHAQLLPSDTTHPGHRQLLNIVEEMAIASGNPVPAVYLLDSAGINAFAAGLTRRDAIIGVTRGTIEQLNREQLQGVIAHEFSHIYNGDMRLNLRLVAILHGILAIGLIGQVILRSGSARHLRNTKKGNPALFGLLLIVLGYTGTFFGNIIKAAVSRQREFLADASAVQFTRNPAGISGALKTIGGYPAGSTVDDENAEQFSHLYFANGVTHFFGRIMATHPPLDERIRRIEPRWKGDFNQAQNTTTHTDSLTPTSAAASHFAPTTRYTINADTLIDHAGEMTPLTLKTAHDTVAAIPANLKELTRQGYGARAVVYALLLDQTDDIREHQIAALRSHADVNVFAVLTHITTHYAEIDRTLVLPILDLCMPSLKQLSKTQRSQFKRCLVSLIYADKHISLFEWCLYRIVCQTLEPPHSLASHRLTDLEQEAALVATTMANAIKIENDIKQKIDYKKLDLALNKLNNLKPLQKPIFLKSLLQHSMGKTHIAASELELFRAIASAIDCPIPPVASSSAD